MSQFERGEPVLSDPLQASQSHASRPINAWIQCLRCLLRDLGTKLIGFTAMPPGFMTTRSNLARAVINPMNPPLSS